MMIRSSADAKASAEAAQQHRVGRRVEGYAILVVNEREARAAAGILFLPGIVLFLSAAFLGSALPLKPFGAFFMIDMLIRIVAGERWSPSLALARLLVRRQAPEWVGASQKLFAWGLGYGMGLMTCFAAGLPITPLWVVLVMCGLCLALLYLEAAFGICVGCWLQQRLGETEPQHCPGESCPTPRASSRAKT